MRSGQVVTLAAVSSSDRPEMELLVLGMPRSAVQAKTSRQTANLCAAELTNEVSMPHCRRKALWAGL